MLIGPGSKIPVHRTNIGQWKNIPSFLYIDVDINGITPEFFQGNGDFIKKAGIDQFSRILVKEPAIC